MKDKIWLLVFLLIPFVFILIIGINYLPKEIEVHEAFSTSGTINEFYNGRIGISKQKRMYIVLDDDTFYITNGIMKKV